MKKNGNIPKFLCKRVINRFKEFKNIFENDPKLLQQTIKLIKNEKKKYGVDKNANNTL